MKTTRSRRAVIVERNVFDFTSPFFSNLIEQKAIDRASNSKCEDARVRALLNLRDMLEAVPDLAVRHEAEGAYMVLRVRGIELGLYSLHHVISLPSLPLG